MYTRKRLVGYFTLAGQTELHFSKQTNSQTFQGYQHKTEKGAYTASPNAFQPIDCSSRGFRFGPRPCCLRPDLQHRAKQRDSPAPGWADSVHPEHTSTDLYLFHLSGRQHTPQRSQSSAILMSVSQEARTCSSSLEHSSFTPCAITPPATLAHPATFIHVLARFNVGDGEREVVAPLVTIEGKPLRETVTVSAELRQRTGSWGLENSGLTCRSPLPLHSAWSLGACPV